MQITLKLFASLGKHLPQGAVRNVAQLEVEEGITVLALLDEHNVPREACHLVLVNGVFQAPETRGSTELKAGDVLAVWPPIAGG